MFQNVVLEENGEDKFAGKVINEGGREPIIYNSTLLNNILRGKSN